MAHLHRSLMIVSAVGSLLLAGCGSSSPAASQVNSSIVNPADNAGQVQSAPRSADGGNAPRAGAATPCALLTQAEVNSAVGENLGPGKAAIPNYDCMWTTTDFSASVQITVSDWAAIKVSATTTGTATAVPGVGDEALTKGGGLLYVRKGNSGFLLMIGGRHVDTLSDHGLSAEKVLAAAVLKRL